MRNILLMASLAVSPVCAEDLARWSAGATASGGISLQSGPDAAWKIVPAGGGPVAAVAPVKDWYARARLLARVDKAADGRAWIVVTYLDRGYGLVSLSGARVRGQWGTARVNTGKLRDVVFEVDSLKAGAVLQFEGLDYVRSIRVTDSEPKREPPPLVEPAFRLARPMDLVIAAGADARTLDGLPGALATLREQLPLARALGFNGIESYVKWNFVERTPGVFDWSFYDALVDEIERHGLRWFPLLIVGSAYALPEWFFTSPEMHGFVCLEHGIRIEIPTIFHDSQVKYVRRFLKEFGKHYGSRKALLGVRLGPSANYGEAQYPATGAWGYRWGQIHTHIGYWAGDPYAVLAFRDWVRARYPSVKALNEAWFTRYESFDEVKTFLPEVAQSPRMRADFATWYMDAMSDWCEKWAVWAREGLPDTPMYQSSGGWGAVPIGTDYTAHSKSMAKLKGGIRLTNENDNYLNNFNATRMAASAARFYGARLGFEPAGFGSARGVMARLYNTLTNGADHLFYYGGNITSFDQSPPLWVKHAPLLDQRAKPAAQIAVFYPDTANKLSDDVLRYRLASAFFERVQALRAVADFDYASEQMILDGALDRYKVLVFLWGRVTEKPVIEKMDAWLKAGGIIIYPERQQQRDGMLGTVEGDSSIAQGWLEGKTGKGRVVLFRGYGEPAKYYIRFVGDTLRGLSGLAPAIQRGLRIRTAQEVYWAALENGSIALLNYDDRPATVRFPEGKLVAMQPYTVVIEPAAR